MSNFQNIIQYFKELTDCEPVHVSRYSMAILESYNFLEKKEQKEFAESFYNYAEPLKAEKPLLFCYAKLTQAFSFFYTEQYDKAFPLLTEAQNLFTVQGELNGAAVCMVVIGNIYRTFGNFDLALKSSWAGHEQLSNVHLFNHFFMACNVNLGGIYFEMKHYDEAIPPFKSVLETAEPLQKYYWTIYALHGLGKVYLIQQKFPEAKECFEKSMEVSEKHNHPLSICNSLSELGNYYFVLGDYPEAEQFNKRSLSLREKNQFIGGAVTSCIRLGEVYIKENKTEDAVEILNKGLKLAEQINVKLKMYQIHSLLTGIYERKNDLEKSLFHYKLFHELREQVEIEDSARKMKNAQLVFEAEHTLKENIIIKKQKEEIEKKNIELQEKIDELTRAKISKKARAFTFAIAIVMFILEDTILHFALIVAGDSYFLSLIVKMVIIFSLSPINKAIENYLFKKVIKKRKMEVVV